MTEEIASWICLTPETASSLHPKAELSLAISSFSPLPYPAGEAAARWLADCAKDSTVPFDTLLALDKAGALLGFYAVEKLEMNLSRRDLMLLALRRDGTPTRSQPGSLLGWMARSRETSAGFGRQLFLHAVGYVKSEQSSVALVVEPHDDGAKKVWLNYRFMPFGSESESSDASSFLWHPVDKLKGSGGWPS